MVHYAMELVAPGAVVVRAFMLQGVWRQKWGGARGLSPQATKEELGGCHLWGIWGGALGLPPPVSWEALVGDHPGRIVATLLIVAK